MDDDTTHYVLDTILVSSRPEFEVEEISEKLNIVSGKFSKTFYALNKRPVRIGKKKLKCKIAKLQKCDFSF